MLWGCVLSVGSVGVANARVESASLIITYTTPTSLQVSLAGGGAVNSGTVIPAGSYMVTVNDDTSTGDLNPNLTISGPGVSLSSNLNSTGMGIDDPSTFGPYTFQTSSSYSVEDSNLGSSTLVTFTTTATASATGSSSSGSTPTSGSSTGSSSSNGSSSNPPESNTGTSSSTSGSKTATMLGTLSASVSALGKTTLSYEGKTAKTLKAGVYTVTIELHSDKVGLLLGEVSKHGVDTLRRAAMAGKSSRTVTLSVGRWFVEASTSDPKTYVSVVK